MWTRKELKDKAKVAFKANYWKSVLMALVLMAVIGGMSMFSWTAGMPTAAMRSTTPISSSAPNDVNVQIRDGKVIVDVDDRDGGKVHVDMDADDIDDVRDALRRVDDADVAHAAAVFGPGIAIAGISLALVVCLAIALAVALYVFIVSPLEVGSQRFFVRNLNQRAEVREAAFSYDNNYKEVVKTLFLRDLFIILWGLLLIVPGIIKAYEYRMIPYLLAEDPTMSKDRAFSETKRMMTGQKWNAFVLDLSFLGWNILSAMTLGILGVFYVAPYQAQTNAALYEKLRYGLPAPAPAPATQQAPVPPAYGTTAQAAPTPPVSAQTTQVAPVNVAAPAAQAAQDAPTSPAAQDAQPSFPVIVSESQPPIPPFAQVKAQTENNLDAATSDLDQTASMPAEHAATTAPLPETGIDATAEMPGIAQNGSEADSPQA